jgi:hypothetical protein
MCRRHYHGADAGLPGARDHRFAIVVEAVVIEMHVAVDKWEHWAIQESGLHEAVHGVT